MPAGSMAFATVQLSMQFMRGVRGDKLLVRSQIDRVGGMLVFSSATVFDEKGTACAQCQGMAKMSEQKWASGESPAVN